MFTNNICKPHISGILTHHVSDHFMSFCIVEGKVRRTKDTPKFIEVENITPSSLLNFKTAIGNTDLFSQFDLNPLADPNYNYNLLSSAIDHAKTKHIPPQKKNLIPMQCNQLVHIIHLIFSYHLLCSICDIVNHITATIHHDYKYFT